MVLNYKGRTHPIHMNLKGDFIVIPPITLVEYENWCWVKLKWFLWSYLLKNVFVKIDLGFIVNDVLNNIVFDPSKVKEFGSRVKWWKLQYYPKQKNELLRIILS